MFPSDRHIRRLKARALAEQFVRRLADAPGDAISAAARQGRAVVRYVPDAVGSRARRHPGSDGGAARGRLRVLDRLAVVQADAPRWSQPVLCVVSAKLGLR